MQPSDKETDSQHAHWCASETGSGACDCAGHEQGRAGVYMIHGKGRLAYIGETSNFRARIRSHSYRKRFQIDKILFRPIEDNSERLATERELIEQLSPIFNRQWQQPRDVMTGRFVKERQS
jgi:excinuclease UvrABC nuclease subunit